MRTWLRTGGLSVGLLLAPLMAEAAQTSGEGLGPHSGEISILAAHMRALAGDRSPEATRHLVQDVRRGLPPAALLAMLERLRATPRHDLAGIVVDLTTHRRSAVRSHACQVLIAQGQPWARGAVLAALEDESPAVRSVAYAAILEGPKADYQWTLYRLVQRGEVAAVEPLVAVATTELLPYLENPGDMPDVLLARLYGGLLKRPGFGHEPRRLAMVATLGRMNSDTSQDELWTFAHGALQEAQPGPQLLARRIVGYKAPKAP